MTITHFLEQWQLITFGWLTTQLSWTVTKYISGWLNPLLQNSDKTEDHVIFVDENIIHGDTGCMRVDYTTGRMSVTIASLYGADFQQHTWVVSKYPHSDLEDLYIWVDWYTVVCTRGLQSVNHGHPVSLFFVKYMFRLLTIMKAIR